jgi:hypothetical protein
MLMEKLVASRNYELLSFSPALTFFSFEEREIQKKSLYGSFHPFLPWKLLLKPDDSQLVLPMSLEKAVGNGT